MNATTGATAVADALRATTSRHRRASSMSMDQAGSVAVPPPTVQFERAVRGGIWLRSSTVGRRRHG